MKCIIWNGLVLLALGMARALSAQAPAADSLSLDSAIARVLATYPAIQQASQGVLASQARVQGSRSDYYPDVTGEGLYARVDPVPSIDLPGQGSFKLYPANNYDAHVAVKQTLFDFGKRSTEVAYSRSLEQAAGHNVEYVQATLAFQTIGTFYAILYLERSLEVQDRQIAALNQHLAVTRERVRTGSATDFDALTTQVRVSTAQSQRVEIVNALERQSAQLRGLMDLPADAPVHPAGTFPVAAPAFSLDSLVTVALAQRPEAKLARDAAASAAIQHRLASLGDRPSLKLAATVGVKNGYVPDLNEARANLNAGVELEVPIFNGFRTRSRAAETEATFQAAQEHARDIERRITTDVQQALADVQASQQQMATSDVQLQQAEAAVSMAEVRYTAGVITNLDVLDAQTTLQRSRLVWLKARYDFVTSRYELDRVLGNRVWAQP